jgi:hypothetical protein
MHRVATALTTYAEQEHPGECARAKLALIRENGTAVEVIDLPITTDDFPSPLFASSSLPEEAQ